MTDPIFPVLTAQERYDKASWVYACAHKELHEAWLALTRENYARNQMDDARSDAEGISADTR